MRKPPEHFRVRFEDVSKTMYLLPRDGRLTRGVLQNLWKTGRPLQSKRVLQNVSFEVKAGTAFGVVGENGAGKTTLLRLTGGVMMPSQGKIQTSGNLAPLVELSAGFVRELSGWDNIRLNAALLGMNSRQIKSKMDAIVEFSGLQGALSEPLRIYSTGMVLRLGFAIAALSDPDVLLVDEVLAVGDHHFYTKCLKKVRELKANGTAILLVSHDMNQIAQICEEGMWLKDGAMRSGGRIQQVLHDYRSYLCSTMTEALGQRSSQQRWGSGAVRITRVELSKDPIASGGTFEAKIHYRAEQETTSPTFGIAIHRFDGLHVSGPNTKTAQLSLPKLGAGQEGWVVYRVNELPLLPGSYHLSAAVYDQDVTIPLDHHDRLYPFRVWEGRHTETDGVIRIPADWQWELSK